MAIWASDGSSANVQALHNQGATVNGDTITLPAGTFTWSTTVTITKNITLIGAGQTSTIILDSVPKVDPSPNVLKCTLGNGSVLFRLSGFAIQGQAGPLYTGAQGAISVDVTSSTPNVRIDHITFTDLWDRPIVFFGGAWGVVDHCSFTLASFNAGGIDIRHSTWKGVGNYGDNSWATPSNFGTQEALFFEDCTFTGYSAATYVDGDGGMRIVVRNCNIFASEAGNHGTETGQRYRGGRTFELYNNTIDGGPSGTITTSHGTYTNFRNWVIYLRSGTGLIWGNSMDRYDRLLNMDQYRLWFHATPWLGADGTNAWDVNHAGGVLFSGTVQSSTGLTLTVAGTPWSAQQWVGTPANPVCYEIRNLTTGAAVDFGFIRSNTSNTLTWASNTQGANLACTAGDSFEIRGVDIVLDQPGRGQGDLISSIPNPTPAWPNQAIEPIRIWGNTLGPNFGNGQGISVITGNSNLIAGREYIYSTDNTAALPGYTPFTYPHPLVSGAPPATPTMIQHLATAMSRAQCNFLTITLPNPALSGNLLILGVQFNSFGTISGVTDDKGNTWIAGPATTNATFSKGMSSFYAQNVINGTQVITVAFTGINVFTHRAYPQAVVAEFNNVAQVNALNGSVAANNSRTAGTITTTVDGDLIWEWGAALSTTNANGGAFNGTSITAGAGFTLLSADLQVGSTDQYQIQPAAGAISPAFTSSGSDTWGSLAMAFKPAAAGTARPAGLRVIRLQHILLQAVRAQNRTALIVMQFPSSGNLLVGTFNAALPFLTSVVDNSGNSWQVPATLKKKDVQGVVSSQIVYAANAITSPTLSGITCTSDIVGTGDMMFLLYDIIGAHSSPLGAIDLRTGDQTGSTGPVNMGILTPGTTGGVIITVGSIDFHTIHTMNSPTGTGACFDCVINDLENSSPTGTEVSTLDMDNPYAHYYNPTTGQVTFTFTGTTGGGNTGIGPWAEVTAEFKPGVTPPPPTITGHRKYVRRRT